MTPEQTQRAETLIGELEGTCDSFDPTEEDAVVVEYLDQYIFNCVVCGWWYEISEESENDFAEMVCRECEDDYE